MFKFLLVLIVITYDVGVRTQQCYMPSGQPGYCAFREQCPALMNYILSSAGSNTNSVEYQRAFEFLNALERACFYVGPQSKICCNQPVNPTGPSQNVPNPPDVTRHRNLYLLDEYNQCGSYTEDKIIGGSNTGIFEFPWMALIGIQHQNGGIIQFVCGGTIINKRYILTAAHCIKTLPNFYKLKEVRVGEHDTNLSQDCQTIYNYGTVCTEGFQTFGIEEELIHDNYSLNNHQNDIALLRLDRNIDFSLVQNVKPICLPVGTALRFLEPKGIVTGWGTTLDGRVSTKLLKAEIPIVSNEECYTRFPYSNYKQICAGGQRERDSCTGDSGGPLQNIGNYKNSHRVVQYGIISYGTRQCGMNEVPSVYTSVPYYMDWILDQMRA